MDYPKLRLQGFSRAETRSLEETVGLENVRATQQKTLGGRHAELGMYEVAISLGPSIITVLGLWLAKNRKRLRVSENAELIHPDGTVERRKLNYDAEGSESDKDVVQQVKQIADAGATRKPETGKVEPFTKQLPENTLKAPSKKKTSVPASRKMTPKPKAH